MTTSVEIYPYWARYIAKDADGQWNCFEYSPTYDGTKWTSPYKTKRMKIKNVNNVDPEKSYTVLPQRGR
jgi:hypothetical protein